VNKGELVDRLAARTGLTKKDARKALDATIDIITEALTSNEEVLLTGFGKFEVRARKRSQRINPQTQGARSPLVSFRSHKWDICPFLMGMA